MHPTEEGFPLLCLVMKRVRKEKGRGRGRARVIAGGNDPGQIGLSGVAADSRPMPPSVNLDICLVRPVGERVGVRLSLLRREGRLGDSRDGFPQRLLRGLPHQSLSTELSHRRLSVLRNLIGLQDQAHLCQRMSQFARVQGQE